MRTSGVLMPISSLPSPYGIGTMGKAARKFVDFFDNIHQIFVKIEELKKEVAQYVIDHLKATVDISEVLLEIEELRKAIESLGK